MTGNRVEMITYRDEMMAYYYEINDDMTETCLHPEEMSIINALLNNFV